ncbi:1698_t:CDS:2, partial [Ambispora leptoticha]
YNKINTKKMNNTSHAYSLATRITALEYPRVWNTTQVKKIGQGNFEADWPNGQNSGDAPSKQ